MKLSALLRNAEKRRLRERRKTQIVCGGIPAVCLSPVQSVVSASFCVGEACAVRAAHTAFRRGSSVPPLTAEAYAVGKTGSPVRR